MTTITAEPVHKEVGAEAGPAGPRTERLIAGGCAIGFATLVLGSNVLAGSTPDLDASGAEVATYISDNRVSSLMGVSAYVLAAAFMVCFACAFYGRLQRVAAAKDMVFARIGAAAALLLVVTFAAVVTPRLVLLSSDEVLADPALAGLVWRIEQAAFMLNMIPVCLAVLGFGLAASHSGLLPRWYRYVAVVVPAVGLLTPFFAVRVIDGDLALYSPGGVVFLSWMLLLYLAGIRQLRSAD